MRKKGILAEAFPPTAPPRPDPHALWTDAGDEHGAGLAEGVGGSWQKGRFSIALRPGEIVITPSLKSALGPFLQDLEAGVGLLQPLNSGVALWMGVRSNPQPSLSMALGKGNIALGPGQEIGLWLERREGEDGLGEGARENEGSEGGAVDSNNEARSEAGSIRYDFCFTWAASEEEDEQYDYQYSPVHLDGLGKGDSSVTAEGEGGEEDGSGTSRGNGHVVGELRPLAAESMKRQVALQKALKDVGIDPHELCHSDEFFGTSALKVFNSFVRPRASKLDAVLSEPAERGAARTAHQIAFLIRRHNADRAESLRNKDRALESALERKWKPFPITVVADNIRSAYNVGSLFRTADTAGVAEVVTTGLSPHPNGHGDKKLRKTAFSALDTVPSRHFESTADAICKLRAEGCAVYCLETTTTAVNLFELELPRDRPVAMVFGNEVTGVDQKVLELCDAVVEVPVFGVKNSLNVASVAAVVVYEVVRKWGGAGGGGGTEAVGGEEVVVGGADVESVGNGETVS